jgi:predicted metal-binding protein
MDGAEKRIIPRKIVVQAPDEVLRKEIEEKYRQRAIELGATDAKVVTTDMVSIDDRVIAKCVYPKCPNYGTSANCPPYAMDIEKVRKVIGKFRYGLFIWLEVPSEDICGPEGIRKIAPWLRRMHEIIARIEAEAYYDGYKLALGFSGGPCKVAFCPGAECSALVSGQPCRHPLKARSAMEAVGIDVMDLAVKVGLDVYPIGASVASSDVPHGMRFGIVFID